MIWPLTWDPVDRDVGRDSHECHQHLGATSRPLRSNFLMNTAKEPLDGYDPFAGFRAEHEGNKQDISIFHSNVVKISDNTSIATPCNLKTTKILPHTCDLQGKP